MNDYFLIYIGTFKPDFREHVSCHDKSNFILSQNLPKDMILVNQNLAKMCICLLFWKKGGKMLNDCYFLQFCLVLQ